ncbi:MAG: TlpA family protein disulfide reductase [Pedobacter sp.]|nr:MAG: TlpA family protein disulfide reductase [Pedobacter sp.]
MKSIALIVALMFSTAISSIAQTSLRVGSWMASLKRADGHNIPIQLLIESKNGKQAIYVVNGSERLKTDNPVIDGDSLIIRMPVFESYFKVKSSDTQLKGRWIKGGSAKDLIMPFEAILNENTKVAKKGNGQNLTGKWKIEFTKADQTKRAAIGNLTQNGNLLSGSVLTPTGDYRFMSGYINAESFMLSTFDGIHALLFEGKIKADSISGQFYSSASPVESWTAVKDEKVTLTSPVTTVKEGSDGKLSFTYRDLDGKEVSLQSDRYKGKVVVIQLMGSWCPNCMDEMAFLSDYYSKNKSRGVEVIALAYELTTDKERSRKSLQRFQKQFNVQYPILNTGVTVSDKERTEKTLPQITEIKVFPTSIILDKRGVIKEINTAFYGPGTGAYYTAYKNNFEKSINALLAAK